MLVNSVKEFFGIHSPSRLFRDEIGKYLPMGIGVGFENEMPGLEKQVNANINELYEGLKGTVDMETAKTTAAIASNNYAYYNSNRQVDNSRKIEQNVTIVNPERTPSENARALKKAGRELVYGY